MANKKYKFSFLNFCLYFIFIPFLYPRGFAEYYSVYRTFFVVWLYAALALAILMILIVITKRDFHIRSCFYFFLLNYAYLVIVTLMKLGGVSVGFQKLFVPPVLMMFCLCMLEKRADQVVRVLSNILIYSYILDLICNYILFRSYFSPGDKHLTFLGHVQVASQIGILGLFLSYILHHKMNERRKAWVLCVLCIVSMLLSETLASLIVLLVLGICVLLYKLKIGARVLQLNPIIYLITITVVSGILLFLSTTPIAGYNILGDMTTFSGRLYIWREGLRLLRHNWITGFGSYGINIKVFWSQWTGDGTGFNYAHSQILQTLLDGGIIQTGLFLLMWKKYLGNIKRVFDGKMKIFANLFCILYFLVMLVESVDVYFYVFIFMSLVAYLPEFSKIGKEDEGGSDLWIS